MAALPPNNDLGVHVDGEPYLAKQIGLVFGFGAMLALMVFITVVGFLGMDKIRRHAESIVSDRMAKMQLVVQMRAAARERTLILNRMIVLNDPFERDDEYMRFNAQGAQFARARIALLNSSLSGRERELLDEQGAISGKAVPLQNQVVDLVAQDEMQPAQRLLVEQAIPLQDRVLKRLTELYEYEQQEANRAVIEADQANREARLWMLALSVAAGVIGIIVAVVVGRRTSQANREREKYVREIKRANEAKSAFLANMSHEIRTPLTAIIGFAEASLDADQSQQERMNAFRTIVRSGKHLLQIINDILDLSKVEADKLEIERLPLSPFQLLAEVDALVRTQAIDKGLAFGIDYQFPLPEQITSDAIRLKQILINLCGNAIKFTDTGHIQIRVECDTRARKFLFSVVDSGIGLSSDQIDKIFSAFTQADSSTSRKYGGTGLGLSLSKRLAEMLGGTLQVTSEPGIGSRFDVTVDTGPLGDVKLINEVSEISIAQEASSGALSNTTLQGDVLLAEDTPDNQNLISMYLRKMGARVTIVENGKAAVEMAHQRQFDLIFMDMQMPVMAGTEAVSILRNRGYRHPIVALTANAMKEDKSRCLQAGCDDFVTKPVNRERLFEVTAQYLRHREKHGDGARSDTPLSTTIIADDPEFKKLIQEYIARLPSLIGDVAEAAEQKDWQRVRFVAHKIRGTGGGYGFQELTDTAAKLGFQLENGNFHEVRELIGELQSLCRRITAGAQTGHSQAKAQMSI
jgi:signal transduction histidine kinase/ActR/RegA family two-component response regulator